MKEEIKIIRDRLEDLKREEYLEYYVDRVLEALDTLEAQTYIEPPRSMKKSIKDHRRKWKRSGLSGDTTRIYEEPTKECTPCNYEDVLNCLETHVVLVGRFESIKNYLKEKEKT